MASTLRFVPTEVIRHVLKYLDDIPSLLSYQKTNKRMARITEGFLFGQTYRHKAMRWACDNGHVELIKECVAHGADPSVVQGQGGKNKASTLYKTAFMNRAPAFAALLRLGANLDGFSSHQRNLFYHRLLRCECHNLSNLYARYSTGALDDLPLAYFILEETPVDTIKAFVDKGADVDLLLRTVDRGHVCPLSAAVNIDSAPIFDFLVCKGARVNPPDKIDTGKGRQPVAYPFDYPWHVPIMAAAMKMPDIGTGMLGRCLAHGADINAISHFMREEHVAEMVNTVLAYLYRVEDWSEDQALPPSQGLHFLLEHGASVKEPPLYDPPLDRPWGTATGSFFTGDSVFGEVLEVKGYDTLLESGFVAVLKMLLENGRVPRDSDMLQLQLDLIRQTNGDQRIVCQWVEVLLHYMHHVPDSRAFSETIHSRETIRYLCQAPEVNREATLMVLGGLFDAGAIINQTRPNDDTSLHFLLSTRREAMSRFSKDLLGPRSVWETMFRFGLHDFDDNDPDRDTNREKVHGFLAVIEFLISKGADPTLKNPAGQTAFDVLMSDGESGIPAEHRERISQLPIKYDKGPEILSAIDDILRVKWVENGLEAMKLGSSLGSGLGQAETSEG
ncbi:hypothetical protein G7046_g3746 [Stylonectria norvegica]|nr:hypothetical protein G7046_g3746 [Stylonectria norvegica]